MSNKELNPEEKNKIVEVFNQMNVFRSIDDEMIYLIPLFEDKGISLMQTRFSREESIKLAKAILRICKIENKYEEIFKWLLGYYDFPEKQEGEGNYYWRKYLREKLKETDIKITDYINNGIA